MAISGRQCSSYKLSLKWCAPIASVAALTERLWQLQISGCSADRIRRCRGGACPARRCTNDSYRLSLKWQALPNCHCEAPTGPWQSQGGTGSPYKPPSKWQTPPDLSLRGGRRPTWRPEREARGSALGVQSREGSCVFADSFPTMRPGTARLPRRFAPRNDTSGEREVHQCPPAV